MADESAIKTPIILTIAGSDSGGGAGIQTDLAAIRANGGFGVTAITCLTAQNPGAVTAVQGTSPEILRAQLEAVRSFFPLAAAKTGMLLNANLVRETAAFLRQSPKLRVVVDPVLVATSGAVLLEPEAVALVKSDLLPQAALITPNLDEAAVLLGSGKITRPEMETTARELSETYGTWTLLKGGHLDGEALVDVLCSPSGEITLFEGRRISGVNTHGSGCTLSAAIAAHLGKGADVPTAVANGLEFMRHAFARPLDLGPETFLNAQGATEILDK
jgi:hydroxymethylpyrimidine/phosphomethylpyrimidine kinase